MVAEQRQPEGASAREVRGASSWHPFLVGCERRRALTAVEAISSDLRTLLLPRQAPEPAWELASAGLFMTYLAQAAGEPGPALAAEALPLVAVFEAPTVAAFAELVERDLRGRQLHELAGNPSL